MPNATGCSPTPTPSRCRPRRARRRCASGCISATAQAIGDRLRLALAIARTKGPEKPGALEAVAGLVKRLDVAERFAPPAFPVTGEDLKQAGMAPGPEIGQTLERLKHAWADDGFQMDREALLARL